MITIYKTNQDKDCLQKDNTTDPTGTCALSKLMHAGCLLSSSDVEEHIDDRKETARRVLQPLFSNCFVARVLREILDNEYLLEEVAAHSYRNVQGFLKVVLVQDQENGWKIRLHRWSRQRQCEAPHSHKWDFYSCILHGTLTQHVYRVVDEQQDQQAPTHMECEPTFTHQQGNDMSSPMCTTCRGEYSIASPNQHNVTLTAEDDIIRLHAGDAYFMPHSTVHAVDAQHEALSIVFTYPESHHNSHVYLPLSTDATKQKRSASNVTPAELRRELEAALCNLC